MDILAKNRHFGQKWTFWKKIDILTKNRNLVQKSRFCPKTEISKLAFEKNTF